LKYVFWQDIKMEIDTRISAVRARVAAERAMISRLTAQNEDPFWKIVTQRAGNLVNDVEDFFLSHALKEQHRRASMWLGLSESAMHLAEQQLEMVRDAIAQVKE
jgi:hypothetical protein